MKPELVMDLLTEWMTHSDRVLAGFWFGSSTTKSMDRVSDIDLALIVKPNHEDYLFSSLHNLLVESNFDISWKCHVASERKIVLWLSNTNLKIDIFYGYETSDLYWLARAQDVPEPRLVEAYPSKIDINQLLKEANSITYPFDVFSRKIDTKKEINKFIIAFEACSSAHARSDAYLFYFHYNLALGRLVRIIQLANHSQRYLYAPRNILTKTFNLERQKDIRELSGSLHLPEANNKKKLLKNEFIRVLNETNSNPSTIPIPSAIPIPSTTTEISELNDLLDSIINRD